MHAAFCYFWLTFPLTLAFVFRVMLFSFARLCLRPAVRKPALLSGDDCSEVAKSSSCNVANFFLSLLAEYASRYLDVLCSLGTDAVGLGADAVVLGADAIGFLICCIGCSELLLARLAAFFGWSYSCCWSVLELTPSVGLVAVVSWSSSCCWSVLELSFSSVLAILSRLAFDLLLASLEAVVFWS